MQSRNIQDLPQVGCLAWYWPLCQAFPSGEPGAILGRRGSCLERIKLWLAFFVKVFPASPQTRLPCSPQIRLIRNRQSTSSAVKTKEKKSSRTWVFCISSTILSPFWSKTGIQAKGHIFWCMKSNIVCLFYVYHQFFFNRALLPADFGFQQFLLLTKNCKISWIPDALYFFQAVNFCCCLIYTELVNRTDLDFELLCLYIMCFFNDLVRIERNVDRSWCT